MTLHLHTSNQLERLARTLAALPAPADPFEVEPLAVPNRTLERWLGTELARHRGILANHRALTLDALLRELDGTHDAPWAPDRLLFPIATLLPHLDRPPISTWLTAHPAPAGTLTGPRLELARRLAEAFARYPMHRPELVAAWNSGRDDEAPWQAALWRRLVASLPARPAPDPRRLPVQRLVVFGYHALPPGLIDAVLDLSNHHELHVFLLLAGPPSRPHPLRSALGHLADALYDALAPHALHHPDFTAPTQPTLLARIQGELLGTQPLAQPAPNPDRSLTVHACGSDHGQVEALRDALLDLLDRDPTLEPRDIAILATDCDRWNPLVQAIFNDHTGARLRLPCAPRTHANPLVAATLGILRLVGTRITPEALLDLVALPALSESLALDPEDLALIAARLSDTALRWGIDDAHRASVGQPPSPQHTWRWAFARMLLGHALPNPDGTLLFELADSPPIAPLDPIEGKAVEPLGRFIGAANLLFDFALDVSPRPLHAWRDRLVALVEALLIHDEPSRAHAEPIFAALHSLIERAPTDLSLDFDALSDLLAAHLPDLRTSASGAIAVGPLLPVRPPARVIALLGMDATRLPRRSRAPGFDLAEDAHQDTRADDRHAILAALSSARDHLIVIYTGYRPGDPRPIEPASPLRELLYRARDGADAIVRHPVEAHHPDHFDVSAPRSFDVDRLEAARILLRRRQPRRLYRLGPPEPRDPTATPFALSDLVQAIAHPARWTFRARLGFDLARIESHRQSLEPVELSPLGRWALRDRLLAWRLAGLSPEACLQSLVATGDLPLGAAGALEFDALMRDVERLTRAALARMPHAAPRRRHVSLTLGGVRLTGSIDDAVEGLLRARAGNLKASDLLTAWVEHLALAATLRQPIESHLVHLDTVATLAPIAPSAAREALFDLLRLATRSRALPTPLFPATSLAWFDWQLRQSTPAVPDFVKHAWLRDSRLRTGDATDPHVALLFEAALGDDTFPFENLDFQTISREVFGPLLAAVSRRPLP